MEQAADRKRRLSVMATQRVANPVREPNRCQGELISPAGGLDKVRNNSWCALQPYFMQERGRVPRLNKNT
jgi:hypothetical protein